MIDNLRVNLINLFNGKQPRHKSIDTAWLLKGDVV